MSGEVVSNVALDAALNELGMLSTITNSHQEYVLEQQSKARLAALDISEDHANAIRKSKGQTRTRASSVSLVKRKVVKARRFGGGCMRNLQKERVLMMPLTLLHMKVPCSQITVPVDSVPTSNLFKSRSMESIDARTSDDSVCATEREYESDLVSSVAEVDSVSSGLHRLNVSE